MPIKPKKLLIIFLLIFVLLTVVAVLINRPSPSPKTGSYPRPSYQPFFTQTTQPEIDFKELSKQDLPANTAEVITIPNYTKEQIVVFFQPIIKAYQLSAVTDESEAQEYLVWTNQTDSLQVNAATAQFSFKHSQVPSNSTNYINEVDALNLAKNWLNQYKLIPEGTSYQTTYLKSTGYELEPISETGPGVYFEFNFFPKLAQFPIWPTYEQSLSPVSIIVTNQGEIFYVSYQLPAIFYSQFIQSNQDLNRLQTSKQLLKTPPQINQAINSNQATITLSETAPGVPQSSISSLQKVNYSQPILGYQFVTLNQLNQFLPVFQLQGTATLDSGETVNVIAYLPALAK